MGGIASEESGKESCVIEPAIEGSIGVGSITQHYSQSELCSTYHGEVVRTGLNLPTAAHEPRSTKPTVTTA